MKAETPAASAQPGFTLRDHPLDPRLQMLGYWWLDEAGTKHGFEFTNPTPNSPELVAQQLANLAEAILEKQWQVLAARGET